MLLLIRVLQGLALGGEYGGAAVYVGEHVPDQQARLLHQLHSDHGDAGSLRFADRDSGNAEFDVEGRLRRLRLAHSLPHLHHPGDDLALHSLEDEGVAHLRRTQEPRA